MKKSTNWVVKRGNRYLKNDIIFLPVSKQYCKSLKNAAIQSYKAAMSNIRFGVSYLDIPKGAEKAVRVKQVNGKWVEC